MKQRQSSDTVERPQAPFIERSSMILIERDDRFPSRGEFVKSSAQFDIVSIGRRDGRASSGPNRSDNVGPNNKVSVVEVQRFVQPKCFTIRTSWTFKTTRWSRPKHSWIKSRVESNDGHNYVMLKQSRMECPIERREVPGIEETQECHRVMLAAGLQL